MTTPSLTDLLRQALDDPAADFRPGQREAVEACLTENARVLVVQRTGWGKSMVYFLAARMMRDRGKRPVLIISPLLALMRNQITAAARIGVRAETINSTNRDDWGAIFQNLEADRLDALIISPERLGNDTFVNDYLLPHGGAIGLLVVDEAHCISDWGHDFRPDYRRILRIIRNLPPAIAILATTATANDRVVADLAEQIGDVNILRGPLTRASLKLQNISLPHPAARLAWLAERLPELSGSGVIYALTIRDVERVAAWLQAQGIDAAPYHGQIQEEGRREELEERLLNNEVKALVATSALGMGFDKPDLGFVIHFQTPQSVILYYQQVGRAGRALESARGILFESREEEEINQHFIQSAFPDEAQVTAVLDLLEEAEEGLSLRAVQQAVNLPQGRLGSLLKLLALEEKPPVVKSKSQWRRTIHPYALDRERIAHLTGQRQAEWAEMKTYLQSDRCLMAFLAEALDDPSAAPCGKCAVCSPHGALPEGYPPDLGKKALAFLRHSEIPFEPRRSWIKDALPGHGFRGRIAVERQNRTGYALCSWGDMIWGELVREGKRAGAFSDELAEGAAEMVRESWKPDPFPAWVTCAPSLAQPELVPDFAQRLAERLGLPFSPCLVKVRATRPQKEMENSFHQCRNLDGAFTVTREKLMDGPVLLVDDRVDSRWTLTLLGALLQEAGSGPVHPLALAQSSRS